jgi:endonuclease III
MSKLVWALGGGITTYKTNPINEVPEKMKKLVRLPGIGQFPRA